MRKNLFVIYAALITFFLPMLVYAADADIAKPRVILLISEKIFAEPYRGWWVSSGDFSFAEEEVSKLLIEYGCVVIPPARLKPIFDDNRSLISLSLTDEQVVKVGRLAKVDYAIFGSIYSTGGDYSPLKSGSMSNSGGVGLDVSPRMRSCFGFANLKIIRIKDAKEIANFSVSEREVQQEDIDACGEEAVKTAAIVLGMQAADVIINRERD